MRFQVKKTLEDKNQLIPKSVSIEQNLPKSTAHFTDNRPQAIAQLKLQDDIKNSAKVKQLEAYQFMANLLTSKPLQQKEHLEEKISKPLQKKKNNTGLPQTLKTGVERLSGLSLDDVTVHYNSEKPAQLQAHAYAQGTDIHLASGQEKHLPHEAWHVVQQKQGRVKPTLQMKEHVKINDDLGLEAEADLMGERALGIGASNTQNDLIQAKTKPSSVQLKIAPTARKTQLETIANKDLIQAKINYKTQSKVLGPVSNKEELIIAIKQLYPRLPNPEALIDEIESQEDIWSLADVKISLGKIEKQIPIPVTSSGGDPTITMPSKSSELNDFGFTTRTRARGYVDSGLYGKLPLRNATQRSAKIHAEDEIIEHLNEYLESGKLKPSRGVIYFTINNSPCSRCATRLANWVKKYWKKGILVIRYANPYGSTVEEFIEARNILREAGIIVKSFPAERYVKKESLKSKQYERFLGMKNRRKKYRQARLKKLDKPGYYDDSDDSEQENEPMFMFEGQSEERSVMLDDHQLHFRPDEIASDGDCFYSTIIALGAHGGRSVQELRQLARDNGARAEVLNPGEWANEADMRALAVGLNLRIRVARLAVLDYSLLQASTLGNGEQTIYIAHIFGGHFVPLREK